MDTEPTRNASKSLKKSDTASGHSLKRSKLLPKETELFILHVECIMGLYLENEFKFTIEVPESLTLSELGSIILECTQFDHDHLSEFYAGRNYRQRKVRFGVEQDDFGMLAERDDDEDLEEIPLRDVYPLPPICKLYFQFDFGDDWIFEIRKDRKKPEPVETRKYPYLVSMQGKRPVQYPNPDDY